MPQVFLCWKWPVKNLVNSDLSSFFNVRAVYFCSCIAPSTYCHAMMYTMILQRKKVPSGAAMNLHTFALSCVTHSYLTQLQVIWWFIYTIQLPWHYLPNNYFRCHHEYFCTHFDTGKSLSEALIFASTNPQYDDRLFIELQVQYIKITSSEL